MSMRMVKIILVHSVMPLILGGSLYISIRTSSLIMYDWFRIIGAIGVLEQVKTVIQPFLSWIPPFIYYSLPDGLWVYSISVFLGIIWSQGAFLERLFFNLLGPILGLGIEFGQLFNYVSGTFDITDLLFILAASISAIWLVEKERRRKYE